MTDWQPGDPLYQDRVADPFSEYGCSAESEMFRLVDDHFAAECSPWGDDNDCVWIKSDGWRWYPGKPLNSEDAGDWPDLAEVSEPDHSLPLLLTTR